MSEQLSMVIAAILVLVALGGIRLMNSPRTAVRGNLLLTLCVVAALITTLLSVEDAGRLTLPLAAIAAGLLVGLGLAIRVTMIRMPQMVAMLNGLGGAASGLVGAVALTEASTGIPGLPISALALGIGSMTLGGSIVAAGKLQGLINQRPQTFKHHKLSALIVSFAAVGLIAAVGFVPAAAVAIAVAIAALSLAFGVIFAMRIGGADMPVAISLLNSLSGIAAAIAGFAVGDLMLVAIGAIVGAAGLILTQIMCRAMNRSLLQVLAGIKPAARTSSSDDGAAAGMAASAVTATDAAQASEIESADVGENAGERGAAAQQASEGDDDEARLTRVLRESQTVVIIPGYGMALAQAQEAVKKLSDDLEKNGKKVFFAIHPVAGRMPGHMNVLLAEVDIPYEKLLDLDAANELLPKTDLVIVIGANDVINPAARSAVGTPIYGMPVLMADSAGELIICNRDRQPGYAGVANPLYDSSRTIMLEGDAKETVSMIVARLAAAVSTS